MAPITEQMIRQRSEHNEGIVSTLEEVSLHQLNIEKIEVIGVLCKRLKILLLQSNVIGKIQNLHKLKELEYLNLALNNIQKVENLQRCEFLTKLDLTLNFITKAGLLSLHSLSHNVHLKEMYLTGNPCADWGGYRDFVVATLPHLNKLDGTEIKPSERIGAKQKLAGLTERLRKELVDEGTDPDVWVDVEIPPEYDEDELEEADRNAVEKDGEKHRPWCPATRVLEARENEKEEREAEEKKKSERDRIFDKPPTKRREKLEPIAEGQRVLNKNEGRWDFTLLDSEDDAKIVLDVAVGKFLDTSLIEADVQPTYVRLLIKGKLLQLTLAEEVSPDKSQAQRNKHTGHLVVTMPKANQTLRANASLVNQHYSVVKDHKLANGDDPKSGGGGAVSIRGIVQDLSKTDQAQGLLIKERSAQVPEASSSDDDDNDNDNDDDDNDDIPPLT
ncbi:hypothetical protein A3770_06p45730 [Chloropicon primus]|uniref:Dynein axonemal assembly factor 11-like CS domain-containing protein n=1 Tax=Chloropicon primus TaxID=1764295 RepID=A0A5B8MR02_9CHLO|nr:hypothetical protein A3770_06p45730 [Chloropicon primus]|eukprot:QDZ22055.1 hypothetical protein A3770_06p45730 [Chloropicon primus]